MGLLLSIMVACVGVVEVIAFYSNVRRSLVLPNTEDNDLETVALEYKRRLGNEYRLILAEMNGNETPKVGVKCTSRNTNFALSTSPRVLFHSEPDPFSTLSTNKCEGSSTSNKLSSMPEHTTHIKQSTKTEEFCCAAENALSNTESIQCNTTTNDSTCHKLSNSSVINREAAHTEMDFTEASSSFSSTLENVYVREERLQDPVHGRRSPSPFPTYELLAPRGSICSDLVENPTISVTEVDEDADNYSGKSSPSNDNTEYWSSLVKSHRKSRSRSPSPGYHEHKSRSPSRRSHSPKPEEHGHKTAMYFRNSRSRSKSPAPAKQRSVSPMDRNVKGDESFFTPYLRLRRRSKSFSGINPIATGMQKSASCNQLVTVDYWRRSPSPFEKLIDDSSNETNEESKSDKQFQLVQMLNDDFKDNLDGLKRKNANEERKMQFRRKRNSPSPSKANRPEKKVNQNVYSEAQVRESRREINLIGQGTVFREGFATATQTENVQSSFSSSYTLSEKTVGYTSTSAQATSSRFSEIQSLIHPQLPISNSNTKDSPTETQSLRHPQPSTLNSNAKGSPTINDQQHAQNSKIPNVQAEEAPLVSDGNDEKKSEPFWVK